jgi:hypothetical protein
LGARPEVAVGGDVVAGVAQGHLGEANGFALAATEWDRRSLLRRWC